MAATTRLARSLLQRTFGASLQRLPVRLASGEAYLPEKPPVEGETSEKVMGWRQLGSPPPTEESVWVYGRLDASGRSRQECVCVTIAS